MHPQAAESQVALRDAAEKLVTVTSEATSEEQSKRTMEHLEQVCFWHLRIQIYICNLKVI